MEHKNNSNKCICKKNKFSTNCIVKKCYDCCDNINCRSHKEKFNKCIICNKNNFKCSKCNTIFKNKNDFNKHLDDERLKILKLELQKIYEKNINENNIYLFDKNTLGEHIYKENNGGNIYIIQNDLNMIEYYKIGITTNLIKRISNYRCGCVIEPKLHYYFPVKNIKLVDNTLKIKIKKIFS